MLCLARTNQLPAGKVPYRKPNVLKSVVSANVAPGFIKFIVSRITSGNANLYKCRIYNQIRS